MSDQIKTNPLDLIEGQTDETFKLPRLSGGSLMLIAGIVVFGIVIALALAQRNAATQPTSGPAPDFELTTFDGETLRLSDLQGKVVLINFWASWCPPCRDEAPDLQATWDYYAESGDVVFLGIAYADNGPKSLAYLEEFGITYINGPDLGTKISEQYHIQGVPETFVIDKEGNVARFYYSTVSFAQLTTLIDDLLEG